MLKESPKPLSTSRGKITPLVDLNVQPIVPKTSDQMQLLLGVRHNRLRMMQYIQQDSLLVLHMTKLINLSRCQKSSKDDFATLCISLSKEQIFQFAQAVIIKQQYSFKSFSVDKMWARQESIAKHMSILCELLSVGDATESFIWAYLMNVGMAPLIEQFPNYNALVETADLSASLDNTVIEDKNVGSNHAQIGEAFCKKWQLPLNLTTLISHHHNKETLLGGLGAQTSFLYAYKMAEQISSEVCGPSMVREWRVIKAVVFSHFEVEELDYLKLIVKVRERASNNYRRAT